MEKIFALCVLCVLCVMMTVGCIEDGPLVDDDYNVDAGTPDDTDAALPDEPDANLPPAPPTLSLTALPMTITVGQSSTVSWTGFHATSCTIGGGAVSGTAVVYPTTTTTYVVTCVGPGGQVTKSVTVTVTPAPAPVCHGFYVTFTLTDVTNTDHCTGYGPTYGEAGILLTPALKVEGVSGVCSIICYRKVTGETITPSAVSGIWLPSATVDVPRWCTTGCARLPDHPANEPNQAGGTWDGRCALSVTPLVCGPQ